MILTDREIKLYLSQRLIEISPQPQANAFQSTAVDLTLGNSIAIFNEPTPGVKFDIDPGNKDYKHSLVIPKITQTQQIEQFYTLEPKRLILAWTAEKISLLDASRIAARVEGKSSLARLGLAIHVTAPTIHSGFSGNIQLEIINHGHYPIILRPNMSICQLIFELTLGVPEKGYSGQFVGQGSN